MALTSEGAVLTLDHYQGQGALSRQIIEEARLFWQMVDANNLDSTTLAVTNALIPRINTFASTSARLAAQYLNEFSVAEGFAGPQFVPTTSLPTLQQELISLSVTGAVAYKEFISKGYSADQAWQMAMEANARAASRLALSGGRNTVQEASSRDPRIVGYARVTRSAKPCAFCAMLASRGAVYSEKTVRFRAHDGCHCQAEPVYSSSGYTLPPGSQKYEDLWKEASKGNSGQDAINAFRRKLEATY